MEAGLPLVIRTITNVNNIRRRMNNRRRISLLVSSSSSTNNVIKDTTRLLAKRKRRFLKMRLNNIQPDVAVKKAPIKIFKSVARRVLLLNRVFRHMRGYAMEKGNHGQISTNAMQLKDSLHEDEKDLMFNPNDYKSCYRFSFPKWARTVCQLRPEDRTPEQLQNLVSAMRQLKDFRKYSNKMQLLLAKITRYEAFGRRRVIIRKGHLGIAFYFIFSGSVGITVDEDEDMAFDKEGKGMVNLMRKGDSFGEISLVQKCERSATVVCMEYTEFLVIDKEDFYQLGINKFAEEEMLFRFNFIKSLDMFKTWQEKDLKELASGGRNMEYLCDKVIEEDSTQSQFVSIITKGQAHVLRLLDLTLLQSMDENGKKHRQQQQMRVHHHASRSSSGNGYYSATSSQLTSPKPPDSPCTLPGYNTPVSSMSRHDALSPVSITTESQGKHNSMKDLAKKGGCSATSVASGYHSSDGQKSPKKNWTTLRRNTMHSVSELPSSLGKVHSWQQKVLGEESISGNIGLGAYIRIDTLSRGGIFGMKYIVKEEEQHLDCKRKFILVSAGCEIIRIPKVSVERMANEETITKLKKFEPGYLSDDKLFKIYERYHAWRSFREKLVDDIYLYQGGISKTFKNRSSEIPKIPRIGNKAYSRVQSPIEHWNMLVETKNLVRKDSKMRWEVSPYLNSNTTNKTVDDVTQKLRAAPFLQNQLLTARGGQRELILTHGGDRVNRLKTRVFAVT